LLFTSVGAHTKEAWRSQLQTSSMTFGSVISLIHHGLDQSQSHIATDGQSVSMSWCRAQFGTFGQRFFFSKLLSCPFWGAREVGSVMCQSLSLKSTTVSNYLQLFTSEFKIYKALNTFTKTIICIYNIYRPRSVQALYSRLCCIYWLLSLLRQY
jgi:hypothetical protein